MGQDNTVILGAPTPINYRPVADVQSVTTQANVAAEIVLTGYDANDDSLTFTLVTTPVVGILSGFDETTGRVVYTPELDFLGSVEFEFAVDDGIAQSAPATVTILVELTVANLDKVRVVFGSILVGDVGSLEASDDSYLVIEAALGGAQSRFLAGAVIEALVPEPVISRLDVRVEAGADAAGVKTVLLLRNFVTGRWDLVGVFDQPLADTVFEFTDLPGATSYVETSSGQIRAVVGGLANSGNTPGGFSLQIDEVHFEVVTR